MADIAGPGREAGGRKKVAVVGATGAVGRNVVLNLLAHDKCSEVVAIVRRNTDLFDAAKNRNKLKLLTVGAEWFEKLETNPEVVASLAGTNAGVCTLSIGEPSKFTPEQIRKVDVDSAVSFGKACKSSGATYMSILTTVGADETSYISYLRLKAEVENKLADLGFDRSAAFRPCLLQTKEMRFGLKDYITQYGYPAISWMFPSQYHEIPVEDLGRAFALDALSYNKGRQVFYWKQFQEILKQGK